MMNCGVSSSLSSQSSCSSFYSLVKNRKFCSNSQFSSILIHNYRHIHLPNCPHLSLSSRSQSPKPIFCSNSPGSGESDSKTVLDAFFLGKALGEALTERIESTVGEILSTVGRLQAEQQKQVQEFQEDVFERAKRAKEKAAREALEEQGRLLPNSNKKNSAESNIASSSVTASRVDPMNPAMPIRVVNPYGSTSNGDEKNSTDSDSVSSITIDD
ncbi:uncharacterized protein At4g13200, chloroplastic-like [Chenopodium quinoa]|uniref:uncharacterized protein At4g13200, chloroplastic-like n=1 Tax=Chenopodium quinoa TaxID=63459 RepID=UPI000B79808F|nr:uncharacterized protein At4g13200, chloroplastic-like [Chenopodium quinoa]